MFAMEGWNAIVLPAVNNLKTYVDDAQYNWKATVLGGKYYLICYCVPVLLQ